MTEAVQTVVVGAGVIGLAVARALALTGREVLILEAADAFGTETSARNSEVIHAGIYYDAGGPKARFCVEGRRKLYAYCESRGVAHKRCGKLIVAADAGEAARLDGILARAQANGVEGMRKIAAAEAQAMEPALACAAALWSPETGIIDSHAFMLSLLGEAESMGAMLALNAPVRALTGHEGGYRVEVGGADPMTLSAQEVVNAAGHGAPALAAGLTTPPRAWYAKGNYFRLEGRAPFSRLIYPAPVAGGLGVHLTLDLGGQARFGPDVEWVDRLDYAVDPRRAEGFYAAVRRYWPDLPDGALAPDYAGVRPKLAGPESGGAAEFRIDGADAHGRRGYVGLYGVESPGLTASLAIADHVSALLESGG